MYDSLSAGPQGVPKLSVAALLTPLSARHRRILTGLSHEDLLWEVPGQLYFTQYNERTGKQARVRVDTLEQLEQQGLIRRQRQSQSAHKLDFFEITPQGREVVKTFAADRKSASSDRPTAARARDRKSA
jgi:DNA-binding HxlR family transcriptional regulator